MPSLSPRCRRKRPFILFHWSPRSRRSLIEKEGLVVGSKVTVHSPGWTPTYLCFSDSPSHGWGLSGELKRKGSWDLWMCWSSKVPGGVFRRGDHPASKPAEYRSKQSIPAKALWMVATRTCKRNGRRKTARNTNAKKESKGRKDGRKQ